MTMPERGGEGNVARGGNNPEKGGNECHVQGATVTIPEYIFIVPGFLGWTHLPDADGASVPYVPESRLLAAEARVREVEAERDAANEFLLAAGRQIEVLRAERDALVPLLRYFLAEFVDDGDEVPRHDCGFVRRPESGYCEFHDKWVQAQAILAREEP